MLDTKTSVCLQGVCKPQLSYLVLQLVVQRTTSRVEQLQAFSGDLGPGAHHWHRGLSLGGYLVAGGGKMTLK